MYVCVMAKGNDMKKKMKVWKMAEIKRILKWMWGKRDREREEEGYKYLKDQQKNFNHQIPIKLSNTVE